MHTWQHAVISCSKASNVLSPINLNILNFSSFNNAVNILNPTPVLIFLYFMYKHNKSINPKAAIYDENVTPSWYLIEQFKFQSVCIVQYKI